MSSIRDLPLDALSKILDQLDYVSQKRSTRVCLLWQNVIENLPKKTIHLDPAILVRGERNPLKRLLEAAKMEEALQHLIIDNSGCLQLSLEELGLFIHECGIKEPNCLRNLCRITCHKISISFSSLLWLPHIFKAFPASVTLVLLSSPVMPDLFSPVDRSKVSPRAVLPYFSRRDLEDGTMELWSSVDGALPPLSAEEEDLTVRMLPDLTAVGLQLMLSEMEKVELHAGMNITLEKFRSFRPTTKYWMAAWAMKVADRQIRHAGVRL